MKRRVFTPLDFGDFDALPAVAANDPAPEPEPGLRAEALAEIEAEIVRAKRAVVAAEDELREGLPRPGVRVYGGPRPAELHAAYRCAKDHLERRQRRRLELLADDPPPAAASPAPAPEPEEPPPPDLAPELVSVWRLLRGR